MANAIAGVGTTFERWSGSAWQFIAEINAIEGPTMDKENIEVTALDTDGGYDEFITGFMEGGTLTLNMNFTRSGYELMKQDFEIDVARDYRITLPDDEDTTLEFEGLVIEIPLTMEAEDKLTADVTIQVTGEVAIASAAAESGEDISTSEESASSGDEVLSDTMLKVGWGDFDTTENWAPYGNNTIAVSDGNLEITYVDNALGAYVTLNLNVLTSAILEGHTYKLTITVKVNSGHATNIAFGGGVTTTFTNTEFEEKVLYRTHSGSTPSLTITGLESGDVVTVDKYDIREVLG